MKPFFFAAPIRVVGKERPRVVNRRAFTPKRTGDCEKEIAFAALNATCAPPSAHDVRVFIWLYYKGARRPDVDNAAKTVLDALNGVWWLDDSQVYSLSVRVVREAGRDGVLVEAYFDEPLPKKKKEKRKKS